MQAHHVISQINKTTEFRPQIKNASIIRGPVVRSCLFEDVFFFFLLYFSFQKQTPACNLQPPSEGEEVDDDDDEPAKFDTSPLFRPAPAVVVVDVLSQFHRWLNDVPSSSIKISISSLSGGRRTPLPALG